MEKFTCFIEERIAAPLVKISETRYLQTIQKIFMTLMPILIFSSFLILAAALPIPGWSKLVAPIVGKLWSGVNSTLGLLSVLIAITSGYHLGEYYKAKGENVTPIATGVVAFLSFMMFTPMYDVEGATVINVGNFGSAGIFASIIISFVSVEMYRFFIRKNFTFKLPEGVPPMVVDAFTSLLPASIVMAAFWALAQGFSVDVPGLINNMFVPLVSAGKGPFPQFLSFFLDRILWFTGIHGSNVVQSVMKPIWIVMITENIEAAKAGAMIPNLFTEEWCTYFIRISVLPICFLAARSKVNRFRALGKLSLPASIFNIAEPIMFGLPMILNPILFVPWVFGFSFLWIWTYLFTAIIPVIPPIITQVAWTIPAPIAAYLGTGGSIVAFLFSALNYVILGLIFWPFFKVLEKKTLEEESNMMEKEGEKSA